MSIKISQLGVLSAVTDATILPAVANVGIVPTTQQISGATLKTYITSNVVANVTTLQGNVIQNNSDIANLYANAGVQSGQISSVQANVTTANTAMKGYVDAINSTLTANAATQAGQMASIQANITTANTAMQGYVNNSVSTANTAMQGYVGNLISTANGNITTANTAMKGYVDAINSTLTANAATQAGQMSSIQANITTANTAMKGYVDNQITTVIGGAPGALDTLQELANALGNNASFSTTITNSLATLTANAASQAGDIATLYANAGVTTGAIVTANVGMKGYVDNINSTLTANAAYQAGQIGTIVSNLSGYDANVVVNAYYSANPLTASRGGTGLSVPGTSGNVLTSNGSAWISGATFIRTTPTTVANLVLANTAGAGARAFVTNANSNTFANLVVGGGTYYVPVFSNGTNWYVG